MLFKLALAIFLRSGIFNFLIISYFSKKIRIIKNNKSRTSCLLLNVERFNSDDLSVMINDNSFNYYSFPSKLQDTLFILSESRIELIIKYAFSDNKKNFFKITGENRNLADPSQFGRIYLKNILLKILNKSKINFLLTCGAYYLRNRNWEYLLSTSKIPIFCLHKESTGISREINYLLNKKNFQKFKELQYYQGNKIFVSNQHTKSLLSELNFFPLGDIEVVGSVKVDKFVNKNFFNRKNNNEDIDITFFSFYHTYLLPDKINLHSTWSKNKDFGFSKLFDSTHYLIAKYAKENPDKKVLIKIKWHNDQVWINYIKNSLKERGLDLIKIKNLKINYDSSTYDLIKRSKLIVGFNSSVLSESILCNKTAIIPLYEEASYKYAQYILWKESNSFLFAYSENHFFQLLNEYSTCVKDLTFNDKDKILEEAFGYTDGRNMNRMSDSINLFLKRVNQK